MNFRYPYLFLCLFLISNSFAQKAKYDGESLTYTQYPLKPLPKELKKYSIWHEGFDMNSTIGKNNGFSLKNYEKVTKGEDFKIKVIFSPVNVDIRTEGSNKNYSSLFFVTFDAHVEITDPNNKIIDTIIITKLDRVHHRTAGPYLDENTAIANAAPIKQSIKDDLFRRADTRINESIKGRIDLINKKLTLKPGYIKGDAELTTSAEKFNEQVKMIGTLKYDGSDKVNKDEINKILSLWEQRSNSLGGLTKENEELYQMYKYNLAIGNFLLGNYSKSEENISEAMKILNSQSTMTQLKLLHIYNFDELVKTHEARLRGNGLL